MLDYRFSLGNSPDIYAINKANKSDKVSNPIIEHKKFKTSKKTDPMLPLIASGAIAAGLLLVGIAAKKKISSSSIKNILKPADNIEKDLWKNLHFQKSNTMEEAVSYSKNVLGIKSFNLENDLETANWVNEGLTNLQNIYKGKFRMPDYVHFVSKNVLQDSPMAIQKLNASDSLGLVINKDFLKSNESFEHISVLLKNLEEKKALVFKDGKYKYSLIGRDRFKTLFENIAELKQGTKKFSPLEINYMARGLDDYANMCYYPNVYKDAFSNLFKDSAKLDVVKSKIPNFPSLEKINKMSIDEMGDLVDNIYKKTGVSLDCQYGVHAFNKFDLLYHEGGHLMHEKNIPSLFFKYHNPAPKGKIPENASDELSSFYYNPKKQFIANRISSYATHSPLEFVAETHIGLCNGYKFSDEIMDLYKFYNGPMP